MKYAFAGAALIAGALAVPAWGPDTETVEVTTLATITSCGPEVTNCPASSTAAWSKPTGGWGGEWSDSWSETWATSSSSSAVTSPVTAPVTTSTSSAAAVTPPTTWAPSSSSSWVVSVSSSTSSAAPWVPVSSSAPVVGPTAPAVSGWAPHGTSSCGPGHPGWPGYSGTAPAGPKPTGSGTGVWTYPGASSSPITPSTGGAAQNVAGLLAGVGAIAAFFL